MRQWEGQRAARLGPAPPGTNGSPVHGHVAGSRDGRFRGRDVGADLKSNVEIVISKNRVSIGQTAEVEIDLAV